MKKIFYIFIAGSLLLANYSCKQGSKQAEESNGVTISDQDDEHDLSDTEGMTEEEKEAYENQDAPDEGLSQKTYEQLEMPAEINGKREIILMKQQFAISYNATTHCPNYVCWHLTQGRTRGNLQRPDDFTPDEALAPSMQVTTHDYTASGYDRGHMCPAGDNKNSREAMYESFSMTNVCPQIHDLNEGDWNELEQLCRDWTNNYGELYICCGPIYDSQTPRTIGKRKNLQVAVPDRFFKVVLTMGKNPHAIGFIFPNDGTRRDLRSYAVSVDQVEKATGIDFYPKLDDAIENKLESECNPAAWGI